jgi:hypothetical protein
MKLLNLLNLFASKSDERLYQVRNGSHAEWITLDELMKRNKEKYFYQNLLGENKHESIERSFRYSNGKDEANQILSVSTLRGRR